MTQLSVFPNVESIFHFSYQICEFMYERELRYDKIIDCYLRDPVRKVSKSGSSVLSSSQQCSLPCCSKHKWAQQPCSFVVLLCLSKCPPLQLSILSYS